MQLTGVKADDIVRCDVRGYKFFGLVTEQHRDEHRGPGLKIRSLNPSKNVFASFVTSRQVIGIWRVARHSTVDV